MLAGEPNFTAENIKKGVVLWGKVGTWEGWVVEETDLYYNGINIAGWTIRYNSDTTKIKWGSLGTGFANYLLCSLSRFTIEPRFTKLNVLIRKTDATGTMSLYLTSNDTGSTNGHTNLASVSKSLTHNVDTVLSFDVSSLHATYTNLGIRVVRGSNHGEISRIWMS